MLASEYILIDISLISCSPICTNITQLWNLPAGRQVYHQLSIFTQRLYRAEVTQTISTAESPGRKKLYRYFRRHFDYLCANKKELPMQLLNLKS